MEIKKHCIIFDLDGTLADIDHRRHHVENKPKNWTKFNDLMIHDQPNKDIVRLLVGMRSYGLPAGEATIIASGRDGRFKNQTIDWLNHHSIPYDGLYMRKAGDNRPDFVVKKEMLAEIREDGFEPWLVFDDRDQVVDMWRDNGLRCLQVAPGAF